MSLRAAAAPVTPPCDGEKRILLQGDLERPHLRPTPTEAAL